MYDATNTSSECNISRDDEYIRLSSLDGEYYGVTVTEQDLRNFATKQRLRSILYGLNCRGIE